jgi:hypothetical protein
VAGKSPGYGLAARSWDPSDALGANARGESARACIVLKKICPRGNRVALLYILIS